MRLSTEKTRTATSTHPGIPCHNHTAVPPRYFHPHAFGRCALCPRQTVRRDALNHTAPCTRMAVRYDCTRHEIAPQLQRVRPASRKHPPPLPQISRQSRRRSAKTNGPFRIHVPRGKDTCIRKKSNWSSDYRPYAHCSPNVLVILIHMLSAARLVVPPPDPHSFAKHTSSRPSSQDKGVPPHANQCDLVDRCQNGAHRILLIKLALAEARIFANFENTKLAHLPPNASSKPYYNHHAYCRCRT